MKGQMMRATTFIVSALMVIAASSHIHAGEAYSLLHQPGRPAWGPDPGTPHEIILGDQNNLPQDVQADLAALNAAFAAIPGGLEAIQSWDGSPDGKVVV